MGWFVGQRLTISWNLRQKRRELDLAIVQQLHAIYGEFKEVIKAWRLAMRGGQEIKLPDTLRWELLARACALEAKYETILIKMASERLLTAQDRSQLASDNLFGIAAIRKPDLKRALERFQKQHTEFSPDTQTPI